MTDEQFHNLVLLALARVSVRTIAAATGASVPSVERWAAGKNFPHPAVRQRFADAIGVVIR